MITLPVVDGETQGVIPPDAIYTVINGDTCTIYQVGDKVPVIESEPSQDS